MMWVVIILFIAMLVFWAVRQAWLARPEINQNRYHVRSHIVDIESLDAKDVFRSHPYWVAIRPIDAPNLALFPEGEALASQRVSKRTTASIITCRPPDLNLGQAREAMRGQLALDTWISATDPEDVRFTQPGKWDGNHLVQAILTVMIFPVLLVAIMVNPHILVKTNVFNLIMYLSGLTLAALLVLIGAYFLIRILSHWMSTLGSPINVEARITGVYQYLKRSGSRTGMRVHVMWRPHGLPVQYGVVRLRGYSRRQILVLKRLIEKQLEYEQAGIIRVPVSHLAPPVSKTTTLVTEAGPTNITVTRLAADDPRLNPHSAVHLDQQFDAAQRHAQRAARKREKRLEKEKQRWETKAQKELQRAAQQTQSLDSPVLKQLVDAGPYVWYLPLEPAIPHLAGVSSPPRSALRILLLILGWALVASAGIAMGIYLIWINPDFLFPARDLPPANQMPLGPWK